MLKFNVRNNEINTIVTKKNSPPNPVTKTRFLIIILKQRNSMQNKFLDHIKGRTVNVAHQWIRCFKPVLSQSKNWITLRASSAALNQLLL